MPKIQLLSESESEILLKYKDSDIYDADLELKAIPAKRRLVISNQIQGRQMLRKKVKSWAAIADDVTNFTKLLLPAKLPFEQCSSEQTARYKAKLVEGKLLVDLTGGLGVDFAFMSTKFQKAIYVEQNKDLVAYAENNLPIFGVKNATYVCDDAINYLKNMTEHASVIYIDPARRTSEGEKAVQLADCQPNLEDLEALLLEHADMVVAKLSPMLDISKALKALKSVCEIHIVSVDNECKELLLVMRKERQQTEIKTYNIHHDREEHFDFTPSEELMAVCKYAYAPRMYLYEPNSSILKSGGFKIIADRYRLVKLHVNSHLYTSDDEVEDFPGRSFEVMAWSGFARNDLASVLRGIKQANIAVRNFPMSPEKLRAKLKLKEGGKDYFFASTLADGKKVLLRCRKIGHQNTKK